MKNSNRKVMSCRTSSGSGNFGEGGEAPGNMKYNPPCLEAIFCCERFYRLRGDPLLRTHMQITYIAEEKIRVFHECTF